MLTTLVLALALLPDTALPDNVRPDNSWNAAMLDGARAKGAGDYALAESRYRDSARLASQLPASLENLLAASLNALAGVCAIEGKLRESEMLYLRSLDIWQRVQPADPV